MDYQRWLEICAMKFFDYALSLVDRNYLEVGSILGLKLFPHISSLSA
jgi:hypothetical protein